MDADNTAVASSWSGPAHEGGTASLHSFNEGESDEGEPVMGIPVNEKLQPYH
jgi:WD repeat-containing protein 23